MTKLSASAQKIQHYLEAQNVWQTVTFMADSSVQMVFFDYISHNLEYFFEENHLITFQDMKYHK